MDIKEFWNAVLKQEAEKLRSFFKDTAYVNWHCTNEHGCEGQTWRYFV